MKLTFYFCDRIYLGLACIFFASTVDGLRCYFCRDGFSNEDCNSHVVECQNKKHDACFISENKNENEDRLYTKGCMYMKECLESQVQQENEICTEASTNCTSLYCCSKESNCNEQSGIESNMNTSMNHLLTLISCVLISVFNIFTTKNYNRRKFT